MQAEPQSESTSNAAEARLKAWLRVWAPTFALGGAAFYLLPGAVTSSLNQGARLTALEESPVDADNLWIVLAGAYMALIAGISWRAAEDPVRHRDLVRFLMLGKAASSFGALGYFLFKRRSYAFLANFLLDGAILAGTAKLLADAEAE